MQFYRKKSEENNWNIRKVCVDIIIDLAKRAKSNFLKEDLSGIILRFLKDGHKTVRVNAHKCLPMFLGAINLPKDSPLIDKLLEPYLKLTESEVNQQLGSNELVASISYSFPAVLMALGKEKWKQLLALFNRLSKFLDK
jgi:serine/threonine-protein phosphatase 4 regulatory subunit 1